ncbi:MAG: mevalonate kinase family protein [Candidatus Thorarchaeota archaeon]|jgi:galactokinase
MERFSVRAPGRVCLFGEHSDYLGLDVISAAIDLAIHVRCSMRNDMHVNVSYLDLGEEDAFDIDGTDVDYGHKRDYLRSAFNTVKRRGMTPKKGWDLEITGNIPVAAGLSSSSALTVAAILTFARMSGNDLPAHEIAQMAYEAEVREFGESGGMMDHFSSSYGGIIHVDLGADYKTTRLPANIEGLVIGDSLEKKEDTVADLKRIRTLIEKEYQVISEIIPDFDQRKTPTSVVTNASPEVLTEERSMAETTLHNRDLTKRAFDLLRNQNPEPSEVGQLLNLHHELLRFGLKRSTRKIEYMIDAAKAAGAIGCKINGSGGGGTMLALAPGREKEVATAIRDAGGEPFRVSIGAGVKVLEE